MDKVSKISWLQHTANFLADSFLFSKAKKLWSENSKNSYLKLNKFEKVLVGIYLILIHYYQGKFPPTFTNRELAFKNEILYRESMPGVSFEEALDVAMRKPFIFNSRDYQFLRDFIDLSKIFEKLGIIPPMKVMELGCGTGWQSEFLSLMKFEVTGTTISRDDIIRGNSRVESLKVKGIKPQLKFIETPMEAIDTAIPKDEIETFDCIFIYEALHHAYSWQETIDACYKCLGIGGWLILCREPNLAHTFISYRVSILTNTHEIGMNRKYLINHARKVGYSKFYILKNRLAFGFKPIWIAFQK